MNHLEAIRSPLKVLHHMDMAERVNRIAITLGLHQESAHYEANRELLKLRRESTWGTNVHGPVWSTFESVVAMLARNTGHPESQILESLRGAVPVVQVELHPSDICNERCRGCTYGHDDPALKPPPICFPFHQLDRIAALKPRAIVLAGGGEPELYKDTRTGNGLPDFVRELRHLLPDTQLGLITNGTRFGAELWMNEFRWCRISIDAATRETYAGFRGKDLFTAVLKNLVATLSGTQIRQVNVGFVFCADNMHETAQAARFFYDEVARHAPDELKRLYIDYRPLRRDTKDESRAFPEYVTFAQVREVERQLNAMRSDAAFARFLDSQTNWQTVTRGNTHVKSGFDRCGYSTLYRLIRANGEVRPCCMRLEEPEFYLGNILHDPPEAIALAALVNAAYLRPGCDADGCKLGVLNRTIETGLETQSNAFIG